jgi:ATP-dependent Clp protease ATP-binding subunit ClpA
MEMVVDKFMNEFKEQLSLKKVSIILSPEARTWLARNGHDPRYGARPLTRLMQTEIKDILADEILFGKLEKGGAVFIDVESDELAFNYTGSLIPVS